MTTDERPLLLVVSTGMRRYREYLLESISTRFRIHLFHTTEPDWERPYLSGWTVVPDTLDGPAMAEAAVALAARIHIDGVLCWDEARIHAASYVAQALGVRNGDPAVIWRLRDKAQTRAALEAAGVAQPLSFAVKTLEEAEWAAGEVSYPAIVKPRGLGGSLGVTKVCNVEELRAAFAFARDLPPPEPVVYQTDAPVLIEHCVVGEEISVDSVVRDGVVRAIFIARKVVGYPPYAEEIGHFVDGADPLLRDPALCRALQNTHSALGFRDGWTHTEFMLTGVGPMLIEVNGRLGGDLIPYLGRLATGIDPGIIAASAACGTPVTIAQKHSQVAGIRFFYVPDDDTVIASIGFSEVEDGAIERMEALAQPGDVCSPPPKGTLFGRVAYATAAGESVEVCRQALDAAQAALEVKGEPR